MNRTKQGKGEGDKRERVGGSERKGENEQLREREMNRMRGCGGVINSNK